MSEQTGYIDIVFDGPPPEPPPSLAEVEDSSGRSIRSGEWIERMDGYWVLRISLADFIPIAMRRPWDSGGGGCFNWCGYGLEETMCRHDGCGPVSWRTMLRLWWRNRGGARGETRLKKQKK